MPRRAHRLIDKKRNYGMDVEKDKKSVGKISTSSINYAMGEMEKFNCSVNYSKA